VKYRIVNTISRLLTSSRFGQDKRKTRAKGTHEVPGGKKVLLDNRKPHRGWSLIDKTRQMICLNFPFLAGFQFPWLIFGHCWDAFHLRSRVSPLYIGLPPFASRFPVLGWFRATFLGSLAPFPSTSQYFTDSPLGGVTIIRRSKHAYGAVVRQLKNAQSFVDHAS